MVDKMSLKDHLHLVNLDEYEALEDAFVYERQRAKRFKRAISTLLLYCLFMTLLALTSVLVVFEPESINWLAPLQWLQVRSNAVYVLVAGLVFLSVLWGSSMIYVIRRDNQ